MQQRPQHIDSSDYYVENGRVVFSAAYLLRRGKCCGSGCRNCPYGGKEQIPSESPRPAAKVV